MSTITLSQGGGGDESAKLIQNIFYEQFANDILLKAEDAAILTVNKEIAFTTDAFTVSPIFFAGGDIGKIAIAGTVNDLAMMAAKPLYLSASFIIEEGFSIDELAKIVKSMADELEVSGAKIVCGDTKVVPKGSVDKIFITTSGIGEVLTPHVSATNIQEGDIIIASGDIGRHGATILMQREELELSSDLQSDCQTLWPAVGALINEKISISAMRDATRGGLSAVLNEWATSSEVCLEIEEQAIVIDDAVQGICEIFGFDALEFANEGTFILAVAPMHASFALEILKQFAFCKDAAIIGRVTHKHNNKVILHTPHGSSRFLDLPKGELLPRIC
jgi:hydrogenase expression/formation protein HypE